MQSDQIREKCECVYVCVLFTRLMSVSYVQDHPQHSVTLSYVCEANPVVNVPTDEAEVNRGAAFPFDGARDGWLLLRGFVVASDGDGGCGCAFCLRMMAALTHCHMR